MYTNFNPFAGMANTEFLLGVRPTSTRPPLPPKPAQIKSGKDTSGSVKESTKMNTLTQMVPRMKKQLALDKFKESSKMSTLTQMVPVLKWYRH